MTITPALFPEFIRSVSESINSNVELVSELDEVLGDGDHVFNLQRGLEALAAEQEAICQLSWPGAWHKIGLILMSNVGGASGSLYATLFLSLGKQGSETSVDARYFADIFALAIDAVKLRGKSDLGEKTLLDVLIPVAISLKESADRASSLSDILNEVCVVAELGVEATRGMLATKGRASFLGERSRGHLDAGAKTAQLMIFAIVGVLRNAVNIN